MDWNRPRRGFTLIELLIVVVISGVLGTIMVQSFSTVHGRMGVRAAESNFLSYHAQARTYAVERAEPVALIVDSGSDEVRIQLGCAAGGGDVLQRLDFGAEFAVDVEAPGNPLRLCFTPRGVAQPSMGTVTQPVRVEFRRGGRTSGVQLLPMGQARSS